MRGAVPLLSVLLAASLAHAQVETGSEPPTDPTPPGLGVLLERAQRLDAAADYGAAATEYERYADACLASRTALLEACGVFDEALARAFELRRALGDSDRAEADATAYTDTFLYAHPREAMRIGYELAQMHVESGDPRRSEEALDRFEALHRDPPAGLALLVDAMRARLAAARGREARAATYWRRVERRWDRDRESFAEQGPVPASWVRDAVAEGRLARAEVLVERYLAVRPPRVDRIDDDERWWTRTMSPWLVRSRRRLLLARMELESVYELGSPRHSVVAAARIGEMYGHQADLHAELTLPRSDWMRTLVNDGRDRPGYEEAVSHLETCVRWASHHGVASDWGQRCEEELHGLDPHRFPIAAELHGQASYHPVNHVLPTESHHP